MTGLSYIELITERLKQVKPLRIILFGSYAYGDPTSDSDIDILVVTNDDYIPGNFSEKSKIFLKVSKTISDIKKEFPVDLLVHTKQMHKVFIERDSLFSRELMTKGKVLYEESDTGMA